MSALIINIEWSVLQEPVRAKKNALTYLSDLSRKNLAASRAFTCSAMPKMLIFKLLFTVPWRTRFEYRSKREISFGEIRDTSIPSYLVAIRTQINIDLNVWRDSNLALYFRDKSIGGSNICNCNVCSRYFLVFHLYLVYKVNIYILIYMYIEY